MIPFPYSRALLTRRRIASPSGSFNYASFLSGKSGDAWLADGTHYTDTGRTTVANVGDTIASLSGAAGAYNASQSTSTARPTLSETSSKRYLSFDGGDGMVAGSAGNWNYLHNGGGNAYMCAAIRFGNVVDPATGYIIASTYEGNTIQVGWTAFYEDRAVVPANNSLRTLISRGVNGSPAIDTKSSDGTLLPQTDVIVEYIKTGASISYYINGASVISATLTSPSASNSLSGLHIGQLSSGALRLLGRIYGLIVCDSVPGSSDRSSIQSDMSARCVTPPI